MSNFIQWCNDNSAFVEILLSMTTVLISIVAIVISIRLARLPFKKKLKLDSTVGYAIGEGLTEPALASFCVSACNIGNRNVRLKFLGFAVEKTDKKRVGDYLLLFNIGGTNGQKYELTPADVLEVEYPAERTIRSLVDVDQNLMMYLYAEDTEGKRWIKKFKTVRGFLEQVI